jgi:hypothetical protein
MKDLRLRFAALAFAGAAIVIAALLVPGNQFVAVQFGGAMAGGFTALFGLEHMSIKNNRR